MPQSDIYATVIGEKIKKKQHIAAFFLYFRPF